MEGPSKVSFNGIEMKVSEGIFGDVSYTTRVDGWPSSFRWEWTDSNGRTYSDSACMDTIELAADPITKYGDDYAITWIGAPIQRNEEVTVSIEGNERDFFDSSTEVGSRKVRLNGTGFGYYPEDFAYIDISRTLKLRRVKEISTENVAGSFITLTYNYDE